MIIMKTKMIFVIVFLSSLLISVLFYLNSNLNVELIDGKDRLEYSKEGKLPNDLFFMQRAYPSGKINTEALRSASIWKKEKNEIETKQASIWEFSGPLNIGGRITDIEIPSNTNTTFYVGAASGGVFRSTDNANTWQPIFDDQPMLSIGDIEISKSNNDIIFVGTGEVNAGGGSLAYDGDGVYRSDNGGDTWQSKGLEEVGSISKVIIDPSNDNRVYVGAMGPLFRADNNRGVYRSIDGGDTWENVLFVSNKTGVIDMAIHPTNTNVLYAVTWERERTTSNRVYGGPTSGIHRSVDGGDTWEELTNGLPTSGNLKGRISVDISQSNPNVLYASYADAIGNVQGVYRTSDGGNTWSAVNSSQLTNVGFHWWFGGLFIDPTDEDIVYHVGFDMQKTVDGGNSWQSVFTNVHVDQHALAFNPTDATDVLLGNDGGLYRSADSGVSYTKDLKLPITQFYRFYVDPQNDAKVYGGSQDNNTIRTTTGGLSDWTAIKGGDGFQPLVDKDNTNVIYALSQRGNLGRSVNDGALFLTITSGIDPTDRNNWDTPIAFDPVDNRIIYYGTNRLYRSENQGTNWSIISPDLTNGPGGGNLSFGTLTTIDISPLDSDIIYIGTDDGNVWNTTDGGVTWNTISDTLPNRWVTRIQASPDNVNTVYVTFSGYRFGEDNGHIYTSTNNGVNWSDISGDIPDIPVNDIEIDDFGNLFLGTDIGVLSSTDNGANWVPFGENMPSVVVNDLHFDSNSGYLYAGTYGRSSYKIDISANILSVEESYIDKSSVKLYPNPVEKDLNISIANFSGTYEVAIYNQLGQLQKNSVLTKQNSKLTINELPKGVYIIRISKGNNSIAKKIIKK